MAGVSRHVGWLQKDRATGQRALLATRIESLA
jgi:hypothetical protein